MSFDRFVMLTTKELKQALKMAYNNLDSIKEENRQELIDRIRFLEFELKLRNGKIVKQ